MLDVHYSKPQAITDPNYGAVGTVQGPCAAKRWIAVALDGVAMSVTFKTKTAAVAALVDYARSSI